MEFWKTEHWLEYLLNSKIGTAYIDHSFYLGNKFVSLIQDGCELYSPGFDDDKAILEKIKEIATQNNIKRIQVDSQIKSYLNISGYTCIMDATDPMGALSMTKGHKSAIKKGQKYLDYNIETETVQFMKDYFQIAGKQTRPEKTFQLLRDWIWKGWGVLFKATFQGQTAGYAYIITDYDNAYYFMGCTFPEFKKYCVSHYLQSQIMEYLCCENIEAYELGDQAFDSLCSLPSEKEKNISLFKRGFGGRIAVKPKSEFFFCKEYFEETMNQRIKSYKERI